MIGLSDQGFMEAAQGRAPKSMVQFYMGIVPDHPETEKQGRPIFKDAPFVRIKIPGDVDLFDQPAWIDPQHPNAHNNRFPKQWEAFRAGIEQIEEGTPLSQWPIISKAEVENLAIDGFKTVEHLANASDVQLQRIMNGKLRRQQAKDFIESAKGNAPMVAMRAELEKRDSEMQMMRSAISQMQAALDAQKIQNGTFTQPMIVASQWAAPPVQEVPSASSPTPKKRGRPAKTQSAQKEG